MSYSVQQANALLSAAKITEFLKPYIDMGSWTPEQGVLLVSGIRPSVSSSYFDEKDPDTRSKEVWIRLDGQEIHSSSSNAHDARRLYREWKEWVADLLEDGINVGTRIPIFNFLDWCENENFDGDWYQRIRYAAGYAYEEHCLTIPSDEVVPISTELVNVFVQANAAIQYSNENLYPPKFVQRPKNDEFKLSIALATPVIASLFVGSYLKWNQDEWSKALQRAAWLRPSCLQEAEVGKAPALWDPVGLAKAVINRFEDLNTKRYKVRKFNELFLEDSRLSNWREEWEDVYHEVYKKFL